MLPTSRRVKKIEFTEIFKKGLSFCEEGLVFHFLDRKDGTVSRFSFVVSSKVSKSSVSRHRIKRVASSVIEENLFRIRPGLSGIFVYQKDFSSTPYSQVSMVILKLLTKAQALN